MPICQPCRIPHHAAVSEDSLTGRTGTARSCFCQHKPRSPAVSRQAAGGAEAAPGSECDVPAAGTDTDTDTEAVGVVEETADQQGQRNTTWSATFARVEVDQGNRGRRGWARRTPTRTGHMRSTVRI